MESGPDVYSPRLSHEVAASTATRSWVEAIGMGSGHSSGGRVVEVVDDEASPPPSMQPATRASASPSAIAPFLPTIVIPPRRLPPAWHTGDLPGGIA